MANHSAINSIYNFYMTTYAPKTDTKYDTHKKSELRGVCNSIAKMNKDDPLYLLKRDFAVSEYAVGIKENARTLRNSIASLGGLDEGELLNKRTARSDNTAIAEVSYIGEDNNEAVEGFDLSVQKLASNQTNTGKYLDSDGYGVNEGTYSFDIGTNGLSYEFQFSVSEGETNKSVQDKLARLINGAGIGLKAETLEDGNGNSAIKIESEATGSKGGKKAFVISDDNTSRTAGMVSYLGLDNTTTENSNAEFTINGVARSTSDNSFTVEKTFQISLKGVNEQGDVTHIAMQADLKSMADNVTKLIDSYNTYVEKADEFSIQYPKSRRLVQEMGNIAALYISDLKDIGITLEDSGRINLDSNQLEQSLTNENISEGFEALKKMAGAVARKTDQVGLNPLNYANRTIVAYKNPGHNFTSPYVTSSYTGMMFNDYC